MKRPCWSNMTKSSTTHWWSRCSSGLPTISTTLISRSILSYSIECRFWKRKLVETLKAYVFSGYNQSEDFISGYNIIYDQRIQVSERIQTTGLNVWLFVTKKLEKKIDDVKWSLSGYSFFYCWFRLSFIWNSRKKSRFITKKFWSTLHLSANVNLCRINGFMKYQN